MSMPKMTFNGVLMFQVLADVRQGVEAHLNKTDSLTLSGTHMTKAELLSAVAALQQPSLDVEAARREYEAKLLVRDRAAPLIGAFLNRFEAAVSSKISSDPHVMAKYGIPAAKTKRVLTVDEKHAKLTKMRATNAARKEQGSVPVQHANPGAGQSNGNGQTAPGSAGIAPPTPLALVPTPTGTSH